MKKLFITDLDGTLLNSMAEISPKTAQILHMLARENTLFSVATARTYATVLELFERDSLPCPIVLMNGVMIYDPKKGKVVRRHSLLADDGKKILDIYANYGIFPLTYFLSDDDKIDIYYKDLANDFIRDYVNVRNQGGIKRFHHIDSELDFSRGDLVYMTSMDSYDVLSRICNEIKKLPGVGYTFCKDNYTDCYFLETFSIDATKASGALEVKELVGADKIIAFGDNLNDISLFEVSDECYAVNNAAAELKAIATGVIGTNDEDAVAKYIYEAIGGKFDELI